MIRILDLPEVAALHAIEHGEFPESVLAVTPRVAVVMTQSWCPDWRIMSIWLKRLGGKADPPAFDLTVYTLIYDRVEYFDSFRQFKERGFRNYEIPYIRYYHDGSLAGESNSVMKREFLRRSGA